MDNFNITTTATLRPELLEKTLQTFTDNLFKEDLQKAHLLINIDHAGVPNNDKEEITFRLIEIYKVLDSFDFGSYKINHGSKPHFPSAFMWTMKNIKYPLFFNLEEDWELLYEVDFQRMVSMFDRYKDLAHLRLSFFNSEEKTCKNWNKFLEWNGDFFEVPDDLRGVVGFCGHPSLNASNFMIECLPYISVSSNPEKQIKGHNMAIARIINRHRFGSFQEQNKLKAINDTGRQWMVKNNFKKAGSKAFFVEWEEC